MSSSVIPSSASCRQSRLVFRSETGGDITNNGNEVGQEQVDEDNEVAQEQVDEANDLSPRCSPPRPVANQGIWLADSWRAISEGILQLKELTAL